MTPTSAQHDPGGKSRPAWPGDSTVTARFSPCGQYRYELAEIWDPRRPLVLWILMNPSVACLDYSDPTLRRTGNFSRAWGYGGQLIGNVHAYRATDKNRLLTVPDPVGPKNDKVTHLSISIISAATTRQSHFVFAVSHPHQFLVRTNAGQKAGPSLRVDGRK